MKKQKCKRCNKRYVNLEQHKKTKKYKKEKIRGGNNFPLYYKDLTQRKKYISGFFRTKKNQNVKSLHWGQRKLHLTEIYFLTQNLKDGDLIIYAGSAPGIHIKHLLKLFPKSKWLLIDPSKFVIKKSSRVQIINDLFKDKYIEKINNKFSNKNILFISDIRSGTTDEDIAYDNKLQYKWIKLLKPRMSMLKFRFPYETESNINYFKGKEILLQPWAPLASTESRLIINENQEEEKYNVKEYEEKFFYHNTETRQKSFKYGNFTGSWDYIMEVRILEMYAKRKLGKTRNKKKESKLIIKIQNEINRFIPSTKIKSYKSSGEYSD